MPTQIITSCNNIDEIESHVCIKINITIIKDNLKDLKDEINVIIKKYAI